MAPWYFLTFNVCQHIGTIGIFHHVLNLCFPVLFVMHVLPFQYKSQKDTSDSENKEKLTQELQS